MLSSYINNSFENLLMNGGDGIAQRHGENIAIGPVGIATATAEIYGADRWIFGGGNVFGTGSASYWDPIGGPGLALSGRQQGRIQRYEVFVAEAAPAASQFKTIEQRIEGTTLRNASAIGKSLLVSFWMNATAAMNLTVALRNSTDGSVHNASYVSSITTVAGWKKYSVIAPAQLISGVHEGTGVGLTMSIALHVGTDFETAPTNAWQVGDFVSTPAQSNFMDTIGNFIEIDQIMVLSADRFSTDFATDAKWVPHLRSPGRELKAMERYYEKTYNTDIAPGIVSIPGARNTIRTTLAASDNSQALYMTRKRTPATIRFYNPVTGVNAGSFGSVRNQSTSANITVNSVFNSGEAGAGFSWTAAIGTPYSYHFTAETEL